MNKNEIPVSEYHKLAVLDLFKITPARTEHNGRFWAYFDTPLATKILNDYDSGTLQVTARDYVAAVQRVKDRIFEAERARARSGSHVYQPAHR